MCTGIENLTLRNLNSPNTYPIRKERINGYFLGTETMTKQHKNHNKNQSEHLGIILDG
ncbi:hypothetical protein [Daejeonia sp. YH14]|uniref:hypothetical protein n=1 Tax=Daejeonia sp. YH14 TaxID=3439042 RepID=UPI003F4994DC